MWPALLVLRRPAWQHPAQLRPHGPPQESPPQRLQHALRHRTQVWDDGTVAAPVLALKSDEPAEVGVEREGDPDYSDDPVEEHLSDDVGAAEYELDTDDDANFSDGPTGS
jgi:hypothetical protein